MKPVDFVWQNGELKPWKDATVHGMAHGLHYGSTVFEGIRCYETNDGPAIFRLEEHIDRLFNSCLMYYIQVPYSKAEITQACLDIIEQNGLKGAYIRPLVYRDLDSLGLVPEPTAPVSVLVGAFEWAPLLGKKAAETGIDICVSSWQRLQSSTCPVMSKAGGHYLTSQLISMEAKRNGYAEGIAVNSHGLVTEGAGSNLFMFRKGKLFTPALGCSILEGITRDSIIELANASEWEVIETSIPREALYTADEVFLCGTAAELAPVISVDRLSIGSGKVGEKTRQLQNLFEQAKTGFDRRWSHWLTRCCGDGTKNTDQETATRQGLVFRA